MGRPATLLATDTRSRERTKHFWRDVAALGFGSVAGQGVLVLCTPIVARLFSPAAVGDAQTLVAVATTVAVVATLRLEQAFPVPPSEARARALLLLVLLLLTGVTLGCFFLVLGFSGWLTGYFETVSKSALVLLPLLVLVTALNQTSNYWLTREGLFERLAVSKFLRQAGAIVLQIGAGLLVARTAESLLLGMVAGLGLAFAVQAPSLHRALSRPSETTRVKISSVLYEYRNFPYFSLPYAFLANLNKTITLGILIAFSFRDVAGYFAVAQRLMYAPASILCDSLRQVFYREAATRSVAAMAEPVQKIMITQVRMGIPVCMFVAAYSEPLLRIALGDRWTGASPYVAALLIPNLAFLLSTWLDRVYDILGRQRLALLLQLGSDIVVLSSFAITMSATRDPIKSVILLCVLSTLYNVMWVVVTFRVAGFPLVLLRGVALNAAAALMATAALLGLAGRLSR